jgi:integrase
MPRPAHPWYRKSKDCWYVTLNGRMISLRVPGPNNQTAAFKRWGQLLAGEPESPAQPIGTPAAAPPPPIPLPASPVKTVGEVIDSYLADASDRVRPITLTTYRRYLLPFREEYAALPVADVSPELISRWVHRVDWSQTVQGNTVLVIAQVLRWAGVTVVGLKAPTRASRGAECVVSDETFARILAETDEAFGDFLRFLWFTGCRPAEATALTVTNIDQAAGVARLKTHKTAHATGRDRLIFLSEEALAVVKRRIEACPAGPIFRNAWGEPLTRNTIVNRFARLNKKLGTKVTAYGFRHTFCSRLLAAGVPDAQVAALAGHTTTATLFKHYAHLTHRSQMLRAVLRTAEEKAKAPPAADVT